MRRPLTLLALLLAAAKLAAQPVSAPHITVELVAATEAAAPGEPFRIGLRMQLEKDWHAYWRNAGDVGLPTTLELSLPAGFTAGAIEWPVPELIGEPPDVSYGYENVLVLPVTITPPATMVEGDTVRIAARASWLVCNEQCIPGRAELALALPVRAELAGNPGPYHEEFAAAEARLPRAARRITTTALRLTDHYEIVIANAGGRMGPLPEDVRFFAADESVIDHSGAQVVEKKGDALILRVPVSPAESAPPTQLRGLLVSDAGWNGGGLRAISVDMPIVIERDEPVPDDGIGGATRAR